MRFSQAGNKLVCDESKELGSRESKSSLPSIQRDIVFQTHLEKLLKVLQKFLEIVRVAEPIVYVVAYLFQSIRSIQVRALSLCT
jgi:hypothetical protein